MDVARSIAGAQSQEPRAGRLQFRARSRRLDSAAVERARLEERSILRTWVMRGTVHLIATEDYGWLAPLYAPAMIRNSRKRLDDLGVPAAKHDQALDAVRKALRAGAQLGRDELVDVVARAGAELNDQTRFHLFRLVCVEGIACIGPDTGRVSAMVAREEWIGTPEVRERADSLAELARRYFNAFAPATERDFSFWAGLPLRDCRVGLERIAGELDEVVIPGETAFIPRGWRARAPRSPVVRLLPAFDTYLMGYASRAHAVDRKGERRILPGGGVLRPTVCVDGRFAGLWSSKRRGKRLAVSIDPFPGFDEQWLEAVAAEVADIGRFEGVEAALA